MFNYIDYSVTFAATTHRPALTLARRHDFLTGFTAITGPNEQGKSFILEMLRFLLFGSAALRGPASDYPTLKVKGEVVILGETYEIERTISKAKLTHDGAVIVTGTKPVNHKLVSILGFGLDVFDVSNCINQGEVERLGSMRPADRQKLVDSVVGLDKIETLSKLATERALSFEREAGALERVIVEPTAPAEPAGWDHRVETAGLLVKAEADALDLARVEGELRAPRAARPVEPTLDFEDTRDELVASIAARTALVELDAELRHMPPVVDLEAAETAIDAHAAYAAAAAYLMNNPAPRWTKSEDVRKVIADWDLIDEWTTFTRLKTERASVAERLAGAAKVECPSCAHTFPLDAATAERQQRRLADIDATMVEPASPFPPTPMTTAYDAANALARWSEIEAVWDAQRAALSVPQAPLPEIRAGDMPRYREAAQRRPELEQQRLLHEDKLIVDDQAKLNRLDAYETAAAGYEKAFFEWEAVNERVEALEARRVDLLYAPARVAELRPIIAAFAPYERDLARYAADKAVFDARVAQMNTLMVKGADWRRAKDALTALRSLIKQHLYPSLAKAASYYIAGMTGGARRVVEIDEGFEILVDGQRLDALSGSAKAVANLSVRFGLGRVLTHSVFPVVLADEIDASMDDSRAALTADILQQCSMSISQMLLVSHKTPEAENYLSLGDNSEQPQTTQ